MIKLNIVTKVISNKDTCKLTAPPSSSSVVGTTVLVGGTVGVVVVGAVVVGAVVVGVAVLVVGVVTVAEVETVVVS